MLLTRNKIDEMLSQSKFDDQIDESEDTKIGSLNGHLKKSFQTFEQLRSYINNDNLKFMSY